MWRLLYLRRKCQKLTVCTATLECKATTRAFDLTIATLSIHPISPHYLIIIIIIINNVVRC
jgi:hypothetical protein